MKNSTALLVFALFVFTLLGSAPLCTVCGQDTLHPPAWTLRGNIYEVNIRQYTPQGSFNAFAGQLDRLKAMGVQILWIMPVNPISQVDRKGSLGSYYAVSDYTAVNPEFGSLDDFKRLVHSIHDKGMKVIIDWVPNHTGADHRWLTGHPDFFVKDSTGKPAVPFDWSDTRQLDYRNSEMRDSMIAAMKYWVTSTDIDGFRCDVAWNVPGDFWKNCIASLRKVKELFMLAEGDKPYLLRNGFDAFYPWDLFHMMISVAKGERPAFALDSVLRAYGAAYPQNSLAMYFTSNHDENSWNQSDFGTFPGDAHAPFAVFTQTMPWDIPLIYSGQEEPVLRAVRFFDKDTLTFGKLKRAGFYKSLLALRKRNIALDADATFRKLDVGDNAAMYAFVREKDDKKIMVILNMSPRPQKIMVTDKSLWGMPLEIFTGRRIPVDGTIKTLPAWTARVYEY
jgi:glycosidase